MMNLKPKCFNLQISALGLLSSTSMGLLISLPSQAAPLELNFIGQSIFPTETFYEGTKVGGLSGITYDSNRKKVSIQPSAVKAYFFIS